MPFVVSVQISSFSPQSFGHAHAEHEAVAARQEARRLALIRTARLDVVVGADRDVELFFPVAVHVAEQEVERAVGVQFPAFERRRRILAASSTSARSVESLTINARAQAHRIRECDNLPHASLLAASGGFDVVVVVVLVVGARRRDVAQRAADEDVLLLLLHLLAPLRHLGLELFVGERQPHARGR